MIFGGNLGGVDNRWNHIDKLYVYRFLTLGSHIKYKYTIYTYCRKEYMIYLYEL